MKERFNEQVRYTKTKTYLVLRYIIAILMIVLYPIHHIIMAHATGIKYNDTYLFHLACACVLGLFVFFEGEIKGLYILYIEHQREKEQKYKCRIIAECKIEEVIDKE